MKSGLRHLCLALALGLSPFASASAEDLPAACAHDAGLCAETAKTPLGLPYRALVRALSGYYSDSRQGYIDGLQKRLAANPSDELARFELIALGADKSDPKAIRAFLDAMIAKAEAAGDHPIAAYAHLLAIDTIDSEAEDGARQVDDLAAAAIREARATRVPPKGAGKAPSPEADTADDLAALVAQSVISALDEDADDRDGDVSKVQVSALDLSHEALKARLDRAPDDAARLSALGDIVQMELSRRVGPTREVGDELLGLRQAWVMRAPGDDAALGALVTAYNLRADASADAGDKKAAIVNADRLEKIADDALAAKGLSAASGRALYTSYLVRAQALEESDQAGKAGILLAGLKRVSELAPGNAALDGASRNLTWSLTRAMGGMLAKNDKGDKDAVAGLETQMIGLIDDPAEVARLRGVLGDAYKKADMAAEATTHYNQAMTGLAGLPLTTQTSGLYFSQAEDLFELSQEKASTFDGAAFARTVLAFASEERVASLGKAGDDTADRAVLQLADNLHDLADKFDGKGDNETRILLLQREVALREPLLGNAAKRADRLNDMTNAYRDLNQALSNLDRDADALIYAQKRVDIRREQAEKRPFAYLELYNYVWALRDLADEQRFTDNNKAALETLQEGERVGAALLKRFPRASGSYEATSAISTSLGNAATTTLFRLIYHKKAEATNLAQLKQLGESDFDYDFLAVSQVNIGGDYLSAGKNEMALTYLAKALASNDKSLEASKDNYEVLQRRALILDKMAKARRALGQADPAIQSLRQRMAVMEKMAGIRGKAIAGQAKLYTDLADLLRDNGGDPQEIAALKAKAAAL